MDQKSNIGTGAANSSRQNPSKSTMEATASNETIRERFMKRISGNPLWQEAEESGTGYVIGGAQPSVK